MTDEQLWNDDEPIGDRFGNGVDAYQWLDDNISPADVMAICQGGCASGVYMPAVTYQTANDTMHAWGDQVFDYIEARLGELPHPPKNSSWSGLACFFLSYAVELWAAETYDYLACWDDEA